MTGCIAGNPWSLASQQSIHSVPWGIGIRWSIQLRMWTVALHEHKLTTYLKSRRDSDVADILIPPPMNRWVKEGCELSAEFTKCPVGCAACLECLHVYSFARWTKGPVRGRQVRNVSTQYRVLVGLRIEHSRIGFRLGVFIIIAKTFLRINRLSE